MGRVGVWAAGRAVIVCVLAAGCAAAAVPAAAAPFVYVANKGRDGIYNISQFDAPLSRGGALTPLMPATVPGGPIAEAIAVSPQGNSAYVVSLRNDGPSASEVWQYSINPITGQLTPKSPATVATGAGAYDIAVTPDGKNAYVTDSAANAVSQYSINPTTGNLTPKSPAKVAIRGGIPLLIAVTPNGKYAYLVRLKSNTDFRGDISEYRINQSTGTLNPTPVATVATTRGAEGLAIAPDGRSAYVSGVMPGAVSQYSINPKTGKLTPKSPATVDTGPGSHDLAIAPDGKNVYVITVENNTVSQYPINPSTGALSSRPASTAATVLHPQSIVIAPDGKSAYVTSENDGKVSQYAINPTTGKIAPMSPATVVTTSGAFAVAVTPGADLSAKMSAPATVKRGATLTYTIKIANAGPSNAWQVALSDHLPSGTVFLKATATGGHCSRPKAGTSGGTVRCHLGKLNISDAWLIHIKVTAKTSHKTIRDNAKVTSVTPDPRRRNNTATVQTKVAK
jgi:uncharacterized repeat protein (TIGR01451 family)